MEIYAAIFDVDGTLVDSLGFWDYLWKCLGERHLNGNQFIPDADIAMSMRTMSLDGGVRMLYARHRLGESEEALVNEIRLLYKGYYENEVRLKSGVREFIEFCHGRGIKMCIASGSTRDLIEMVLEREGLREYFSEIFTCPDLGTTKEEPYIYLKALEHLGEDIRYTWVFEDSLSAARSAKSQGFNTVGIFDRLNSTNELLKKYSDVYVDEGKTLLSLCEKIK